VADRNDKRSTAEAESRSTVEVRLLGKRPQNISGLDGIAVSRHPGDVFLIDRALYEADLEPDRGMGRPAQGRTFAPVAEEKAVEVAKQKAADAVQSRIAAVREGVRDQLQALEVARAQSKVQEAENAKAIAESLTKPLERPGARRVG
jgi:hypothetical protein